MRQRMRPEAEPMFTPNNECVGCRAHIDSPCSATCPFETRVVDVALILRLAAIDLTNHQRFDGGFYIEAAISSAALCIVDTAAYSEAWKTTTEAFRRHLLGFLRWKDTDRIVERWGARSEYTTIFEELLTAAYSYSE
ncbi:hypothetical protein ACIBSW_06880 [Actinoplanes sp. NPDC049668]|uniref:hypothetical protein n=1 Tax=unclassified Actinoplanes TaxID=2626549 RepID=UPI0033ADEEB2